MVDFFLNQYEDNGKLARKKNYHEFQFIRVSFQKNRKRFFDRDLSLISFGGKFRNTQAIDTKILKAINFFYASKTLMEAGLVVIN